MNFSRFNSKNDPKQSAGRAPGTAPSAADTNNGPTQADQKGSSANPAVQAPSTADVAKSDGQHARPEAETGKHATLEAASEDKTHSEAMVSEGGHASPGKTPGAIREPAAGVARTEPVSDPTDGTRPGVSAKSGL